MSPPSAAAATSTDTGGGAGAVRRSRGGQPSPRLVSNNSNRHALITCLLHYAVVIPVTLYAHDAILTADTIGMNTKSTASTDNATAFWIGSFLFCYSFWLLGWRLYFLSEDECPWGCVLYKYSWLCNISLHFGWISLWTGRPWLARAHCVTIGIDQTLWYVDVVGYAVLGKFPVGVCAYLLEDSGGGDSRNIESEDRVQRRRRRRWYESPLLSCTHHFWMIPLLLYGSNLIDGRNQKEEYWPLSVLWVSFWIMVLNVSLSRGLTPKSVTARRQHHYLNVNLSHEVYKDLFLFATYEDILKDSVVLYFLALFSHWQALNAVIFFFLSTASRYL